MECVRGIGGVFFKADDPDALQKWYEQNLGLEPDPDGCVVFRWRERDDVQLIIQDAAPATGTERD